MTLADPSDLGPSIALDFVKAYGPIDRRLCTCFPSLIIPKTDLGIVI